MVSLTFMLISKPDGATSKVIVAVHLRSFCTFSFFSRLYIVSCLVKNKEDWWLFASLSHINATLVWSCVLVYDFMIFPWKSTYCSPDTLITYRIWNNERTPFCFFNYIRWSNLWVLTVILAIIYRFYQLSIYIGLYWSESQLVSVV